MRDIAKEADINSGLIHHYFDSSEFRKEVETLITTCFVLENLDTVHTLDCGNKKDQQNEHHVVPGMFFIAPLFRELSKNWGKNFSPVPGL